jgi:hypothetical protein
VLALPPEIWRIIFTLAIRLPGWLDTSPPIPGSDEPKAYTVRQNVSLSYGSTTKRALILVSRKWWSLSIDLFYEYIRISRPYQLVRLIKALESNISRAGDASVVSTFVRHIYMDLEHFYRNKDEANAFTQLFSICNNIQILRMYDTYKLHAPVITPQRDTLRYLRLEWRDNGDYCIPLIKELEGSSALQVLHLLFPIRGTGLNGTNIPNSLSFPCLHSLGLVFDPKSSQLVTAAIASWELPSLIFAQFHLAPSQQSEPLEQFFTSHGSKLTSLQMDTLNDSILHLTTIHCSMLEDLLVLNYSQDHSAPFAASLPKLGRIRLIEKKLNIQVLKPFLQRIFSLQRPLLQRIQVSDFCGKVVYGGDINEIKTLVDLWGKERVRLEGGEGMILDLSIEGRI